MEVSKRCMILEQATERFQQHRLPGPKPYYSTNERPDVWFEPTEVWELRGADLTLSAVHKAAFGLIHDSRGVSLRYTPTHLFPAACALRNVLSAYIQSHITCKQTRLIHCIELLLRPYLMMRRFPRFVRLRDDKRPEEASGPDSIRCSLLAPSPRYCFACHLCQSHMFMVIMVYKILH